MSDTDLITGLVGLGGVVIGGIITWLVGRYYFREQTKQAEQLFQRAEQRAQQVFELGEQRFQQAKRLLETVGRLVESLAKGQPATLSRGAEGEITGALTHSASVHDRVIASDETPAEVTRKPELTDTRNNTESTKGRR